MTAEKARATPPKKRGILSRNERLRLMLRTQCDERTVRKWERGETVRESARIRLETAARDLKLPMPDGRKL